MYFFIPTQEVPGDAYLMYINLLADVYKLLGTAELRASFQEGQVFVSAVHYIVETQQLLMCSTCTFRVMMYRKPTS
jgi:hypothetical protein